MSRWCFVTSRVVKHVYRWLSVPRVCPHVCSCQSTLWTLGRCSQRRLTTTRSSWRTADSYRPSLASDCPTPSSGTVTVMRLRLKVGLWIELWVRFCRFRNADFDWQVTFFVFTASNTPTQRYSGHHSEEHAKKVVSHLLITVNLCCTVATLRWIRALGAWQSTHIRR